MATVRLLDKAGVDFTYAGKPENCCGTPMLVAGKWDLFARYHAQKYRGCKTHRCGYGSCLLSGLRHDVAQCLSRMGEKIGH